MMLKNKHLRLDQEKIERVREILEAKTETEALDKALDRIIQGEEEKLRRGQIIGRMIQLRRKRLGKMRGPTEEWIRQAREDRSRGRKLVKMLGVRN